MTHTSTEQPEALILVDKYEIEGFLQDHRFAQDHWCRQAVAELRRQHARIEELEASESRTITQRDHCEEVIDRMADAVLGKDRHEWASNYDYMDAAQEVEDHIAELEAQLAAIGAGGMEPLRKQAAVPLVPQGWKPVQIELLERIQESLGSFLSDQGWSQSDMDTADALGGLLAAAPQPPACNQSMQPELAT